jgi:hypothetical protein
VRHHHGALALGLVAGVIHGSPAELVDTTVATTLALGAKLNLVALEHDVRLCVAVTLVVDRLVTRRGTEGDLQIRVARVSHAILARDRVPLVVRRPKLDRLVVGFGGLRVFHGQRRFAQDLARLFVAVLDHCRDHDLVLADLERAFVVERVVDVLARLRRVARGLEED